MHLFRADLRSIWRCIEFSKPGLLAGPAGATWTVEWSPAFPGPEPPVIDPGFFLLLLLFRSCQITAQGPYCCSGTAVHSKRIGGYFLPALANMQGHVMQLPHADGQTDRQTAPWACSNFQPAALWNIHGLAVLAVTSSKAEDCWCG